MAYIKDKVVFVLACAALLCLVLFGFLDTQDDRNARDARQAELEQQTALIEAQNRANCEKQNETRMAVLSFIENDLTQPIPHFDDPNLEELRDDAIAQNAEDLAYAQQLLAPIDC